MTTPPVPRSRIDPWPDLAASIEAIRCAIERAAIYLNGSTAKTAWNSPLRYELLCRRRLHLLEGSERRCTGQRFEQEIKPRYAEALHACRTRSAEAPALDLPGDAP